MFMSLKRNYNKMTFPNIILYNITLKFLLLLLLFNTIFKVILRTGYKYMCTLYLLVLLIEF